jgi:hypothetical protein
MLFILLFAKVLGDFSKKVPQMAKEVEARKAVAGSPQEA